MQKIINNNFEAELISLAERLKKNNLIVLAVTNYLYERVALNWVAIMKRLNIENYILISLDKIVYKTLKKRGINTVLSKHDPGQRFLKNKILFKLNRFFKKEVFILKAKHAEFIELTAMRLYFLKVLLDSGIDVLNSDIDSAWLKNPIPRFIDNTEFDYVGTQGTVSPKEIFDKWGFVLMYGFFYLKSNENTKKLINEVLERAKRKKTDDQVSMNETIYSLNVTWDIKSKYFLEVPLPKWKNTKVLCSRDPITGITKKKDLRIFILPHHLFQRLKMPDENPYITQFLGPKSAHFKEKLFKEGGSFFLDQKG